MGDPRPEQPDMTPEQQAQHLRPTGNGPTVQNEEAVLAEEFGEPNADGIYGAPECGDAA
ncbi:hypothetical protein ACN2WE_04990 [Streptomyces sp. cg28]|uniref:hypothetical protein n=1 Tax=Streptomyces sp. cg28 TaxID=3403457 RepID=UPI003B21152C